jgi:hypothetical protein
MAMQWLGEITKATPSIYPRELKFSASEGYSNAKMKSSGNYTAEKNAITENQNISEDDFADPADFKKDISPNLLLFEYPIKPFEFAHLRLNPYGLIDADGRLGWLKEVEWKTENDTAKFTLILQKT